MKIVTKVGPKHRKKERNLYNHKYQLKNLKRIIYHQLFSDHIQILFLTMCSLRIILDNITCPIRQILPHKLHYFYNAKLNYRFVKSHQLEQENPTELINIFSINKIVNG